MPAFEEAASEKSGKPSAEVIPFTKKASANKKSVKAKFETKNSAPVPKVKSPIAAKKAAGSEMIPFDDDEVAESRAKIGNTDGF
ncbi:hypothetical protein D3C72_2166280 [compost metagenome]